LPISIILLILLTVISFFLFHEKNISDFNAFGTVSKIENKTITINNATGSDKSKNSTFNINTDNASRIETKSYKPILLTDINIGDRIAVKGEKKGDTIYANRIISFSYISQASTTKDIPKK